VWPAMDSFQALSLGLALGVVVLFGALALGYYWWRRSRTEGPESSGSSSSSGAPLRGGLHPLHGTAFPLPPCPARPYIFSCVLAKTTCGTVLYS